MLYTVKERTTNQVIAKGIENQQVHPLEGNLYFEPEAVNMEHLRITERTYTCPYKGVCYWIDLESPNGRFQNIAWVYQNPKSGYERIQDRIGFYTHDTSGTVTEKETLATSA
jgi:uncharacterized protein (DUF427 family)